MNNPEYEVQKALGTLKTFCVVALIRTPYECYGVYEVNAVDNLHAIQRCKDYIATVTPQYDWVISTLEWRAGEQFNASLYERANGTVIRISD